MKAGGRKGEGGREEERRREGGRKEGGGRKGGGGERGGREVVTLTDTFCGLSSQWQTYAEKIQVN